MPYLLLEFSLDVSRVDPDEAASYVEDETGFVPNKFEANYAELRKTIADNSHGFDRKEMPVIPLAHVEKFTGWIRKKRDPSAAVTPRKIPAGLLLPTQSQIWLEKIVKTLKKGGASTASRNPIVVSADNYILDGHHRWASVMAEKPFMPMAVLQFNLPIKKLIGYGLEYNKLKGIEARESVIRRG